MFCNRTNRIYCDVEDIQYAAIKLKTASDEMDVRAAETDDVEKAMQYMVDSALYAGALCALDIIASSERVERASDFMVRFERKALTKYTNGGKE